MNNKLSIEDIAKRYNSLDIIIDSDDKWHLSTKEVITKFIHDELSNLSHDSNYAILNAGSAGYSYSLPEDNITHIDVAKKHIGHLKNAVIANIENMPFNDCSFDLIICVGSVLNYCDPIKVFDEYSRVLKHRGKLILEYESSKSFEFIFKKSFNKKAAFIETFFDAHFDKEKIWVFSEKFICQLAELKGFKINKNHRFHIISPLIYKITGNSNFASAFIKFDSFLRNIPFLRKFSSNIILSAEKVST